MELIKELLPILNVIIKEKKCYINIHNFDEQIVIQIKERFKRRKIIKGNIKSDLVADLASYCLSA